MEEWYDDEYVLTEMQGTKVIVNNITKSTTKYAQNKDIYGKCLLGWQCVLLRFPNGVEEFALYNEKGQPVTLSPSIETIGARIDIEKTKLHFDNRSDNYGKHQRGIQPRVITSEKDRDRRGN
jgi:hypothetical protein